MVKSREKESSQKTIIIVCIIAVVVIALAAVLAFTHDWSTDSDAAVRITYYDQKLTINQSTLAQMQTIAAQQNLTLNRSYMVEKLTELEVLKAEARRLGISPSKNDVDLAVAQRVASLDQQGLDSALAEQNMTRDGFITGLRSSIEQDLTLRMLFQQEIVSHINVTDDQLLQIYQANPEQFTIPEQVSAKHILICYQGATACTANYTRDQALKLIAGIYTALQQNASFEALAQQYSTDTLSAARGGDLGAISKGQTVPEFEKVAFGLPVGMISQPFETVFGFHLVAVYAKQFAQQLSFEQVYADLKQQVILQQANAMQQTYIDGLMSHATVELVE